MHYIWWVPVTVLWSAAYALLSHKLNVEGDRYFWILWGFIALTPVWLFISRVSTNMLFDAILFDCLILLTFAATLTILGHGNGWSYGNWLGLGVAVVGMVMMKL